MLWNSRREEDPPESVSKPVPREKLPPQLQRLVDHDDNFYDDLYSPYSVDSTETPYRYAGYANRLRTVLLSAHRYVAYTSDIGESFRPVAHPYLVRSAYAISWTYLIGDVTHEGYKAYLRNRRIIAPPCSSYKDAKDLTQQEIVRGMATGNLSGSLRSSDSQNPDTLTPWPTTSIPLIEDYRTVMAKRAIFQGVASMGLPALTIHSVVKYSGRALKNSKAVFFRTWAPIGLGLAVVPFLPYIFDEPVEHAVESAFRTGIYMYAGEDAARPLPRSAQTPGEDTTSLSSLLHVQREEHSEEGSTTVTWEEYKEERQKAKEQRRQERKQNGASGVLAMLGFGGEGKSKDKNE